MIMKQPHKWEPDTPVNIQVQKMFGARRTKRGFGKYTAAQYRKAIAVLKKKEKKQVKKNEKRKTRKTSNSF